MIVSECRVMQSDAMQCSARLLKTVLSVTQPPSQPKLNLAKVLAIMAWLNILLTAAGHKVKHKQQAHVKEVSSRSTYSSRRKSPLSLCVAQSAQACRHKQALQGQVAGLA